ncbi:hypothetical protein N9D31_03465, partial [Oligoflexaceae bacterium]|nr:hypothetical protein [Oligoflexaceae bacterium]
ASAPVFGADQSIQSRPTSTVDSLDVRNEVRRLALLFAPNLDDAEGDAKDPTEENRTLDCDANVNLSSPTSEELEVVISVDFVKCPELVERAKNLNEMAYKIQGRYGFICENADFSAVPESLSLKEFSDSGIEEYGCDLKGGRVGMKSRSTMNLRMTADDSEGGVIVVTSELDSEESNKGDYCVREKLGELYQFGPCRSLEWSKSFFGSSEDEALDYNPNEERSGTKYMRSEVLLQKMTFGVNDTFYRSGKARVAVNGWSGSVEYSDPLASPEFNIGKGDGEISTFRLPLDKPGAEDETSFELSKFMTRALRPQSTQVSRYRETYRRLQSVLD